MKFTYAKNCRIDNKLAAFFPEKEENKAKLLKEVCCNSTTAHVIEGKSAILVPNHAAEAVADHLKRHGWNN